MAYAEDADTHHTKRGFTNPYSGETHGGLFGFLRARLFDGEWQSYQPDRDRVPQQSPSISTSSNNLPSITWLGHSTVLIQHRGVNVLTDPMFSLRASPLRFLGPKRISPMPLAVEALPDIDAVVISHNHYDHLDRQSIRALGNQPMYFVPLGIKSWLINAGIEPNRVIELDWWQKQHDAQANLPISITATPSQHFSGRGVADRNKTLWASWSIAWPDFHVWFGGDTGYNDQQFKQIGQRLAPIDLSIIPIGAYAPRNFMKTVHVNPAEAVQIHQDLASRASMGIHWGTFILSGEGVLTPLTDLASALENAGIPSDRFTTYAIGETRQYRLSERAFRASEPIPLDSVGARPAPAHDEPDLHAAAEDPPTPDHAPQSTRLNPRPAAHALAP